MIHHRDQIEPKALLANAANQWHYLGTYAGDPGDVTADFTAVVGQAPVEGVVASWIDTTGPTLSAQFFYSAAWYDVF